MNKTHRQKMIRINISINEGLLKIVDEAAEKDYSSRSGVIRTALLWYLRPQGRDLNQVEPEVILQTLRQRKMRTGIRRMLRDDEQTD